MKPCQQCGEPMRDSDNHNLCPRCNLKRHVPKVPLERSYLLVRKEACGIVHDVWVLHRVCPGMLAHLYMTAKERGLRCYRKDFPAVQI